MGRSIEGMGGLTNGKSTPQNLWRRGDSKNFRASGARNRNRNLRTDLDLIDAPHIDLADGLAFEAANDSSSERGAVPPDGLRGGRDKPEFAGAVEAFAGKPRPILPPDYGVLAGRGFIRKWIKSPGHKKRQPPFFARPALPAFAGSRLQLALGLLGVLLQVGTVRQGGCRHVSCKTFTPLAVRGIIETHSALMGWTEAGVAIKGSPARPIGAVANDALRPGRESRGKMTKQFKIVVERHPDGYVAYPLGVKGVVVGQGDTYDEALDDVTSAIRFHIETFGEEALEIDPPVLEAFLAEAGVEC